ncbi:MAG: coenzyme-B sulfoethylthiotransferase subunit beta [Candidatus Methanospirareceae archaeon]
MAYLKDRVTLYNDRGEVLAEDIPVEAISPLHNPGAQKVKDVLCRTILWDAEGAEYKLKTGHLGDEYIHIPRTPWLDGLDDIEIVANIEKIAKRVEELLRVDPDDDTEVQILRGGKYLLVRPPTKRAWVGLEYTTALTNAAFAITQAVADVLDVDWRCYPFLHAAIYGRFPQTPEYDGGTLKWMIKPPIEDEAPGYVLRNMLINHIVACTRSRTLEATALCSLLEVIAGMEIGELIGGWYRHHLLTMAYQGFNANNLVREILEECGKEGTIADVVTYVVEKLIDDKLIRPKRKLPSGYTFYTTDDVDMYMAYVNAGLLAAVIINCGSARACQGVMTSIYYYSDQLEMEIGLPGPGFGVAQGTALSSGFFSHTIYGGSQPGLYSGNHVITRPGRYYYMPCYAAAVAMDAGTQTWTPEMTSEFVGDVFSEIDIIREPMETIAEGALEVKDKFK